MIHIVFYCRWFWCALVFILVFSFDSPGTIGATDDLSEFLAPIKKPAGSEVFPISAIKKSAKRRIGFLCSSKQGIRLCKDPESGEAISFTLFNLGSPHIVPQTRDYITKPNVLISELNFLIHDKFRDYKIEVPFPQRDIHIRSGHVELKANEKNIPGNSG